MRKSSVPILLFFFIPFLLPFLFSQSGRSGSSASDTKELLTELIEKVAIVLSEHDFEEETEPVYLPIDDPKNPNATPTKIPDGSPTPAAPTNAPGKDSPTATPTLPPTEKEEPTLKTIRIDTSVVYQYPEFPTGCECAAAVMALLYYDIHISLADFIDNYLPRCPLNFSHLAPFENGTTVYDHYFVGNPRSIYGKMCFEDPLITAINNYFAAESITDKEAVKLTGKSLTELLISLQAGPPVLVWVTVDLATPVFDVDHYKPSHTVLLTGYDQKKDLVYYNDSINGKCKAKRSRFEEIFNIIGKRSVAVVQKED